MSEESWCASDKGLGIRDLAMYVVLPEIDGRVLTRSVSFKEFGEFNERNANDTSSVRTIAKSD